jgi:signal transduction histidine kinase
MHQNQGEPRVALGNAINHCAAEIEERWLAQVLRDIATNSNLSPTDLRDAIPKYLRALANELLHGPAALAEGGTAVWIQVAKEHALTRVRQGFDIDQLVHEFILLRRTMVAVLQERESFAGDVHAELIAELIDAGIVTAVRSYVEWRDYDSRRQEAEHIGFITHELRNPLAAAQLAATYLRQTLSPSTAKLSQVWETLENSLARLRELIDRTLLTERLEADAVDVHPEDTTLGKILAIALPAAQAEARAKGVEFVVTADPNLRLRVDPDLTASALQNLVDNAVKFTDRGQVEVSVESTADQLTIHVRDNCQGLSPEELRTLFLPFRRGHSGKPGSGLGLAIAKRAIEKQGGSIAADSALEGGGCHFQITLPRACREPTNASSSEPAGAQAHSRPHPAQRRRGPPRS